MAKTRTPLIKMMCSNGIARFDNPGFGEGGEVAVSFPISVAILNTVCLYIAILPNQEYLITTSEVL